MSLLIISEGIFLFLIGNKVIFHKKYASQVDPNVKCSKQVQFRVPKLFPNDPNGVLKLGQEVETRKKQHQSRNLGSLSTSFSSIKKF
jgi:hypothetical protein